MAKSEVSCSFSYIMAAKLKALKGILKSWNKEVFGKVEVKKKEALCRVSLWDELEKQRELVLEEREEIIKVKEEFKSWAVLEEISWRHKSKELWLKEGDRNTGYFHRMANAHRRRNCLRKNSINGKMPEKEAERKTCVSYHETHTCVKRPNRAHMSMQHKMHIL